MTIEDWQNHRTLAIAQMASCLLAADTMANGGTVSAVANLSGINFYAKIAIALFDAVDAATAPSLQPIPEESNGSDN